MKSLITSDPLVDLLLFKAIGWSQLISFGTIVIRFASELYVLLRSFSQ